MKNTAENTPEAGFSLTETLFAVFVISILASAAILHGSSIYRNAVMNYEAQTLVNDLKLLQVMSRSSGYDTTNFPMKEKPPPRLAIITEDRFYRMSSIFWDGEVLRTHFFSPPIRAEYDHVWHLSFKPDGSTFFNKMGSIRLIWGRYQAVYRVVIDSAGRIRVDR